MITWTAEEYREYTRSGKMPKNTKEKAKSKYHAKSVSVDGLKFPSKKEADFYVQLKLLTQAGEISGFCRQPRFVVTYGDDNNKAVEYVSDFIIFNNDGTYKIVDTKGLETNVFKLKMKSFYEKYPKLKVNLD